jgi:FixJ family two-component response regulator
MIVACPHTSLLYIVDPQWEDYGCVADEVAARRLDVRFFRSGREALRSNADAPNAWIVNQRLPDMSGVDLLAMLRWR